MTTIKIILILCIILATIVFWLGIFAIINMDEDDIEQAYRDNNEDLYK